ncbi:MAG TPA: Ig-like domain-containing protein, partial [Candidatus Binatia bacterium]|nr:Ig-like domain-containing protein [Candidatus Binatia bacterium]
QAWSFDPPTATDNGGSNVTITVFNTVTNTSGHCGNTFDATRTWVATDACGNSAQCSQTVNAIDTIAPVITCANTNKTVELGQAWSFDPPTATDNGGTNVTITVFNTVTNTSGHCGNTFDATRTWVATDACGNSAQCSQTVLALDQTPIVINSAPGNLTNCPGTIATFNVNATGTGLSYLWLRNASVIGTNARLTLSNLSAADVGSYQVIITDQCGNSLTNSAALSLNQIVVATPLASSVRNLGDSVTFATVPSGTGPFTYTWTKNGTAIAGADTNSLCLTNLDYADDATYTVQVSGACNTAVQAATLTINHPPTVSILSPTNGAVFIAPATFTVLADAQDVDGTVTNVDFFLAATNHLGQATNAPYFVVLSNLVAGSYSFTAKATDNLAATGTSAPVSVTIIDKPPLTLLSAMHRNPATGLFDQTVSVNNPTYSDFNAVRVYVANLLPGQVVYNSSGYSNGIPYVQSYVAIPPGSSVPFTIEYYVTNGILPYPLLRAELVSPSGPSVAVVGGRVQHINQALVLANHNFLLNLPTLLNRVYYIQYSSDLLHWKTAVPAITGNGLVVPWVDDGLPKTESLPASQPQRFYRLVLLP